MAQRNVVPTVIVIIAVLVGVVLGGCLFPVRKTVAQTPSSDGEDAKQAPAGDIVKAKAIQITDSQGRVRMEFSVDSDDSCGIRMFDKAGQKRLACGVDSNDDAWLGMYDKEVTERVLLRCGMGQPELLIFDPQQERAVEVAYYTNGPGIVINKGKDDHRLVMGTDLEGRSYFSMYDAKAERIELDVAADSGKPTMTLGDRSGKTLWRAP